MTLVKPPPVEKILKCSSHGNRLWSDINPEELFLVVLSSKQRSSKGSQRKEKSQLLTKLESSLLSVPHGVLFLWGLFQVCNNNLFSLWFDNSGNESRDWDILWSPWQWQISKGKIYALGLFLLRRDQTMSCVEDWQALGMCKCHPTLTHPAHTHTYTELI